MRKLILSIAVVVVMSASGFVNAEEKPVTQGQQPSHTQKEAQTSVQSGRKYVDSIEMQRKLSELVNACVVQRPSKSK